MRALHYLAERTTPVYTETVPPSSLPYVGDTVVLRDGAYRITDVVVDGDEDDRATARITLSS
jgi:hypothetical protein